MNAMNAMNWVLLGGLLIVSSLNFVYVWQYRNLMTRMYKLEHRVLMVESLPTPTTTSFGGSYLSSSSSYPSVTASGYLTPPTLTPTGGSFSFSTFGSPGPTGPTGPISFATFGSPPAPCSHCGSEHVDLRAAIDYHRQSGELYYQRSREIGTGTTEALMYRQRGAQEQRLVDLLSLGVAA